MKTMTTIDGVELEILRSNSYRTAVARKGLSAPARFLKKHGWIRGRVLDYGCGRGTDADLLGADKYDPHFFPEAPKRKYKTILCTYVLNVLPPQDAAIIVERVKELLLPGGVACFAVRRDVKEEGVTSRGTLQHNAECPPGANVLHYEPGRFAIYYVDGPPRRHRPATDIAGRKGRLTNG